MPRGLGVFGASVAVCCSCSHGGAGFPADAAPDAVTDAVVVTPETGPDEEDTGIYPYYGDGSVALEALRNDLWLSCPTYGCAGDVPVAGGVVDVTCQTDGDAGGHCTFDCSASYAAAACEAIGGVCSGVCMPGAGSGPPTDSD